MGRFGIRHWGAMCSSHASRAGSHSGRGPTSFAAARLIDTAPDAPIGSGSSRAASSPLPAIRWPPSRPNCSRDRPGRGGSRSLRLRLGDAATLEEAFAVVADSSAKPEDRLADIATLGEIHPAGVEKVLLGVATAPGEPAIRAGALAALEGSSDPIIPVAVIGIVPDAPPRSPPPPSPCSPDGPPGRRSSSIRSTVPASARHRSPKGVSAACVSTPSLPSPPRWSAISARHRRRGARPQRAADIERSAGCSPRDRGARSWAGRCSAPPAPPAPAVRRRGPDRPDLTSHDRGEARALLAPRRQSQRHDPRGLRDDGHRHRRRADTPGLRRRRGSGASSSSARPTAAPRASRATASTISTAARCRSCLPDCSGA